MSSTLHLIQFLPDVAAADLTVARLGGKGFGLARLLQAGLPVPEAWVIAADVDKQGLDADLTRFWTEFRARWPAGRLAVRSSGVAEDTADASFAGVYSTVLNVNSAVALIAAVAEVAAAARSPASEAYRARAGFSGAAPFAILLQRMVEATRAGVLMTANPLRPLAQDEIVIEASYGLGEAVVSGRTEPDRVLMQRSDGTVKTRTLGAKQLEIVWDATIGHTERAVEPGRRAAWALTQADLQPLHDLALRIDARFGPRYDLEFAFEADGTLQLLQLRPMTALPPVDPVSVWSRRFGDEYLADYTMPLSYTLLGVWIRDVFMYDFADRFGFRARLAEPPIQRHEGYAYASGAYVVELLAALPRSLRTTEAIDWFPPLWHAHIQAPAWRPRQLARMAATVWRDKASSLQDNPTFLDRHAQQIETQLVPLLSQDYGQLSRAQWHAQLGESERLGRRHFEILRWGMGFHSPLLHSLLQRALRAWCAGLPSVEAMYADLIGGIETKTSELNRELWQLARIARADMPLCLTLRGSEVDVASLRAITGASPFWAAFDAFLQRYGHRSSTREISAPRWVETPVWVLGLVRAQLAADAGALSPAELEARSQARRVTAQQQACQAASQGLVGPLRGRMLRRLIELTQRYTQYRENQRFYLDYILLHVRQLVLEAGRRLVARGILPELDAVFLLEADEFRMLMASEEALSAQELAHWHAVIAERRAHWLRWRNRLPPLWLFDGIGVEADVDDDATDAISAEGVWRATAASRGQATGTVRVVHTLAELADVQPGDVLVAPNTDPGWTSVFPLLGGLITETGGLLSHGALLAREYGLPAVTGLRNATSLFVSGQRVEIDGGAGTVRRR